jgi:hypothetical protein
MIATAAVHGLRVELDLELVGGVFVVKTIVFDSADGGPVTSAKLRAVPVERLVREALADTAMANLRGKTPLEQAAEIYRTSRMLRRPPVKAVQDALELSPRTASNWIRRARRAGLLEGRAS